MQNTKFTNFFGTLIILLVMTLAICFAVPATADAETPGLIITQLMPQDYPPDPPNNGFIVDIYEVSSKTKKCPPGAILTLSFANGDVEAYGVKNLRIIRYDENDESWSTLQTTLDTENNAVSAPINVLGIYTISHVIVEDTEAPTVSWWDLEENATFSVPTTIEVEASDNVGVAGVTFYIDDVMIDEDTSNMIDGEWGVLIDFSRIVPGTHTLKAEARDLADNKGVTTRTIIVQSNALAPCTTIRSVLFDLASQVIVVSGTASDGDGRVESVMLKLDGEPVRMAELHRTEWTGMFYAVLLTPGKHTLTAMSVDDAGNAGSTSVAADFPLSLVYIGATTEPPQLANTPIALTASSAGGTNVEYQFLVSDGITWSTLQAFAANTTCTWTPTAAGDYTVKVLAREQGRTTEYSNEGNYTISSTLTGVSLTTHAASPCAINSMISLTATATGGANSEYEFQINDGKGWTILQEYDLYPDCIWIPDKIGNYTLRVSAREQGSTAEFSSTTLPYSVKAAPALQAVTLAISPTSPQPQYGEATLTATPTGGGNVEYKFQIFDGKKWQMLRDFNRDNSYSWWLETLGNFTLRVLAREIGTTKSVMDDEQFTTAVRKAITKVELLVDEASPQPATSDIFLLAVPTDGLQVEYQFLLHDGQKWTTLQEYSTDQRYFWTPQIPGTYSLKVTAREIGKKVEIFQKIGYTISAVPALSAVKFTTEPESPQLTQTKIELIATTTGGVNIEYQFLLFDGENWTVLRDFAGEEFCNWIPPNAGFFTLKVNAREVGTTESVSREMVYSIGAPLALSGVVLSTDNFFPIVNNEVTLTAAPNGGGSVEYSFMVDDGGGWKTLRGYSTVPTVKLDFKKSGDLFAEGFGA